MNGETWLPVDAQSALEWPLVLEHLAHHATSVLGASACRTLPLEATLEAAERRMQETSEMVALRAGTDGFPGLRTPDVRDHLGRTLKGGALDAPECREVGLLVQATEDVVRYAVRHRQEAPALAALAEPLPPLPALASLRAEIEWVVDTDGVMKESASSELKRLTQQVHHLKEAMRRRLEAIVHSTRYADVLQDRYFVQREGRYVLPVKTELRTKIPGIVHDVSSSGATVFFEPRELVELNNAIRVGELAVDREVRRILQELSGQIGRHAEALAQAQEILAALDVVGAKAALAMQLRAQPVPLSERGRVRLLQARHPLLALSRASVVANDIVLDEPVQVMVISGANTGGKTVTLKLVGLFALMVRAGLWLPCDAGSEMAWFAEVFADIGDAQDLAKDLSSFSSHVMRMIQLLQMLDVQWGTGAGAQGRYLVLLDEPMTSTDPAEGAALAQALLSRLASRGAKAIVTTHYTELKAMAQSSPGFVNASVEFDVARLAPTYRLLAGIPGGSSAIEIAGRLGMDEALLEDAREHVRSDELDLERLLSDVQSKQRAVADELARTEVARREAEALAMEARLVTERVRQAEQTEQRQARKKMADDLQRARASIQDIVDGLKRERTVEKAKAARARLAAVEAESLPPAAAAGPGVPLERLSVGDVVELANLGTQGILLETPAGRPRVRVRVGGSELSVPIDGLVGGGPATLKVQERGGVSGPPGSRKTSWSRGPVEEPPMVVDVRGRAADEALDDVIAALDRATLGGSPVLRIIHGHGTGKLKTSLRDYLKHSPYVTGFRAGDKSEGGDGATIVELKR